jgi:molybdenum cofactor cytidylyltransferase
MRFGLTPTKDALGSILAHSMTLPKGRLRKGCTLTQTDLDALMRLGHSEITVAQLGAGDVHEDRAATRLANALMQGSTGLRATTAATGRVNLIATSAGLARLNPGAIHALNAENPMISLATVPNFHQLHAGAMLGTIKMISYAVPETDLARACALAESATTLAQPLGLSATLIITQIKDGADETKSIAAINDRLTALDATLQQVQQIPHERALLTAAIAQATTDLILILTGSATSDIRDTAPSAVVAAGGKITRFGMPVDPGNLLFLAKLNDRPVIGLPGCARAPALNGADIVLSRILCGIEVTNADIAQMGLGGLLKEIPTRPRPRQPKTDQS